MNRPLDVAMLVKQVPIAEALALRPDGRLVRDSVELEMNTYCRRAVTKGVEIARDTGGGRAVVVSLGPPASEDVVREGLAAGATNGVLVCDPAFAGSDTLATARALAGALSLVGPFDLVLAGLNSVDADTGQVGPEVAELLGLPFVSGVRALELDEDGGELRLTCERDDGVAEVVVALPAVVSVAERLCSPAKFGPEERAAVPASKIRRISAVELGPGPWGAVGSPTQVGRTRLYVHNRDGRRLSGTLREQVDQAASLLAERGALEGSLEPSRCDDVLSPVPGPARTETLGTGLPTVLVLLEAGRASLARELLGVAAELAVGTSARVVGVASGTASLDELGSWGADEVVTLQSATSVPLGEEDVAVAAANLGSLPGTWAVLAPGTSWGRHVAARVAVRLGAGLTGDAIALELDGSRLVSWKPAFSGQLTVAIQATSPVQIVTVRPGVLPVLAPRAHVAEGRVVTIEVRGRVRLLSQVRHDGTGNLARAGAVIGIGAGVPNELYHELEPLRNLLNAELVATRRVTDQGFMARNRQVGLTGLAISPCLYIVVGASGKFNHLVGVRGAGTILAINSDPDAPVFRACDIGIVSDWRKAVAMLAQRLGAVSDELMGTGMLRTMAVPAGKSE